MSDYYDQTPEQRRQLRAQRNRRRQAQVRRRKLLLGLLVLAGYVLLVEDNQWLRLSAVKAVAVYLFFTFVIQAVGYVPDVLGIISDAGNLFNAYISVPVLNDIVTLVKDLIYLAEKIFLMVLGVKALNQGTVAVPFVDKLVVKYL